MEFNDNEEFIKIAVLESEVEAQVVSGVLDDARIPHWIRSYHDTAYDGLFQFQKGWGEIRVPVSRKQEVLGIIDDIRSRNFEEWEGESDEGSVLSDTQYSEVLQPGDLSGEDIGDSENRDR